MVPAFRLKTHGARLGRDHSELLDDALRTLIPRFSFFRGSSASST
jgi:hypothetical protein